MDNVAEIFDKMSKEIKATQNYEHKKDLLKLYKSCENIYFEITNELVECKRRKHQSVKLRRLQKEFEQAVENFEQWLVFSRLLS